MGAPDELRAHQPRKEALSQPYPSRRSLRYHAGTVSTRREGRPVATALRVDATWR
jgi:hypothetical protein